MQVRHEESAALMACGYAKYTGKLGVCLATSGPGGIHLLNGLYDAKLDGQPVLAITGMPYHDLIGTHTQQDVELDGCSWTWRSTASASWARRHVENVADLACRTALASRGWLTSRSPSISRSSRSAASVPSATSRTTPPMSKRRARGCRTKTTSRRAADILNAGKKVVILAGRGALGATDELEQVAEMLAAPIVKALLGKAAVPDDSPYTTGGSRAARHAPVAGGHRDVRHAADGRHVVPVHRVLAEARPGARRADRARSRCASASAIRRGRARRRQPADAARRSCRCSSATTTARFLETRAEGNGGMVAR